MGNIIKIIESVILLCVVLFAVFFVVGRLSAYVILSGSMEPVLPVGSVVITQKQSFYHAGDMITFKRAGEKTAVTHRIAAVEPSNVYFGDETFITKGDANKTADTGTVSQSSVTGKVLFAVPYLGYIADFAKSPKGFLALIIIPATIIIYEELKKVKNELAKLFKKKSETDVGYIPQVAIFGVIAAVGLMFTATAGAYFFDREHSLVNILGAATSFGEKTAHLYNSDPYTCPDGATNTADPTFGFVVLKLTAGTVKADVKLIGASANASYDLWINQDPGGCPLGSPTAPAALTTDASGNGLVHVETAFIAGATKFWISAVGGGQILRSVSVTL